MPSQAPFFLDAPTLQQATSAYTNNGLTEKAPDGYYSDGVVIRRLYNGKFITLENIPPCNPPCNPPMPITTLSNGVFDMAIHTGKTGSDIGAIVIKFTLQEGTFDNAVSVGLEAEINGVDYYKVVNENYGVLTVGGGHNDPIIRWIDYNALSAACYPDPTNYYSGDIYDWNAYTFVNSAVSLSYTVDDTDVNVYIGTNPGTFFMVVPKISPLPELLNIRAYIPCYDGLVNIQTLCPTLLPSVPISVKVTNPSANLTEYCALALDQSIYYVKTKDDYPGFIEVNTMVFKDQFGQVELENGYYKISPFFTSSGIDDTIYVAQGVVTAITQFC